MYRLPYFTLPFSNPSQLFYWVYCLFHTAHVTVSVPLQGSQTASHIQGKPLPLALPPSHFIFRTRYLFVCELPLLWHTFQFSFLASTSSGDTIPIVSHTVSYVCVCDWGGGDTSDPRHVVELRGH